MHNLVPLCSFAFAILYLEIAAALGNVILLIGNDIVETINRRSLIKSKNIR